MPAVGRESGMPLFVRLPPPCISPWGKGPAPWVGIPGETHRALRWVGITGWCEGAKHSNASAISLADAHRESKAQSFW